MQSEASQHSPAQQVLAIHAAAVLQVFEWTGQVRTHAHAHKHVCAYFRHWLEIDGERSGVTDKVTLL